MYQELIKTQIAASAELMSRLPIDVINQAAELLVTAYKSGYKLLAAGNGGSASDAQHTVAELVGRFLKNRRALPAIALSANTSNLTAIGNDYGYAEVFSRQIEALGQKGDVFLGISTSGNSENVVLAAQKAKAQGLLVIGLTGDGGGKLKPLCDVLIAVPSKDTPRIQESHILIQHMLCDIIEQALFS